MSISDYSDPTRVSDRYQWAIHRISDDPVVVIDTAQTPKGHRATIALAQAPALAEVSVLRSPTWEEAKVAHWRMIEECLFILKERRQTVEGIQRGLEQMRRGEGKPLQEAMAELRRQLGVRGKS